MSLANSMALANRLDGNPAIIFGMLSDGEIQEGLIWEAAMITAHYKLDNLNAIIDNKRL